ncbi:coil containing protein [Vibrio phage 1.097.O._10N.286.49.B3]|uniref:Coil containing protein n=1 Tax=Vibrio phage 1.097.O._10N.286.49.B3 TaxID=1881383 RepID=A0A2I7R0I0_9CAUD|nr:coil containing protein [Vibrio phage 1.097.O._10N.286.49.B3]AUR87154.1 coil containing protein [Vibrio phage 1.097.O._10N.286.49.B3]
MKLVLTLTLVLGMLVGCTISKQATHIRGDITVVSENVDKVHTSIGEYSNNQEVLAELDELQESLLAALDGGPELLNLDIYYAQATDIYHVLKAEAVERDSELTDAQRRELQVLDAQVLHLNEEVVQFKEDTFLLDKLGLVRYLVEFTSKIRGYNE